MTVDLSQVREDHGMVQAHAETVAAERIQGRYGDVSFRQGHRAGWWDAWQRIVAPQAVRDLMWPARAVGVFADLLLVGVLREVRSCDLAIQSAREALAADDGDWFDPDTARGWSVLEPHVLHFLDLTDTELQAVA